MDAIWRFAMQPKARRDSGQKNLFARPSSPASRGVKLDTCRISSAVRDHDLAEMAAPLEMAVGCLGLGKRERPIDHGAQAVQRDGPVHHLKIRAAPDADRTEGNAAAGQQ